MGAQKHTLASGRVVEFFEVTDESDGYCLINVAFKSNPPIGSKSGCVDLTDTEFLEIQNLGRRHISEQINEDFTRLLSLTASVSENHLSFIMGVTDSCSTVISFEFSLDKNFLKGDKKDKVIFVNIKYSGFEFNLSNLSKGYGVEKKFDMWVFLEDKINIFLASKGFKGYYTLTGLTRNCATLYLLN